MNENERTRRAIEKAFQGAGLFPQYVGRAKVRCKHIWDILFNTKLNDNRDEIVVSKCNKCKMLRRRDYTNEELIKTRYLKSE